MPTCWGTGEGGTDLPLSLELSCDSKIIPSNKYLFQEIKIKKYTFGTGEMAQLQKALAILTKDPGSVPSARMVAPNSLHLQLQGI